ncbi:hypothetical protein [Bacillus sp. JJ1474]|uniref:hypothetical protein n=1 Tax=Bacillus sp. JJ1474 TaxID=3122955 RepID=UPI002FFF4613
MNGVFVILISMGLGTLMVILLNNLTGFTWPDYVGGLFIADILRNIFDSMNISIRLTFYRYYWFNRIAFKYNLSQTHTIITISIQFFLIFLLH